MHSRCQRQVPQIGLHRPGTLRLPVNDLRRCPSQIVDMDLRFIFSSGQRGKCPLDLCDSGRPSVQISKNILSKTAVGACAPLLSLPLLLRAEEKEQTGRGSDGPASSGFCMIFLLDRLCTFPLRLIHELPLNRQRPFSEIHVFPLKPPCFAEPERGQKRYREKASQRIALSKAQNAANLVFRYDF